METMLLLSLILQLGHPSFAAREQATATLARVSPEAYLVWGKNRPDAEIAARCHSLLNAHYWKVSGEMLPTNYPYQPWVDSLNYDYPERYSTINAYLDLAGTQTGQHWTSEAPLWGKYRIATRIFLYHQLKAGRSKADLVKLLDAMVDYEKNWILKNKDSYKFPAELLQAAAK